MQNLTIRLNKRGQELYPWLAKTWLIVYGYNPNNYSFVIWDSIMGKWQAINEHFCEGVDIDAD